MQEDLRLSSYHYHLPPERIAQHPAERRDESKLLVLDGASTTLSHRTFADLGDLVAANDLLVVNDTRVFPARLAGRKESGGKVEVFLLDFPVPAAPGTAMATALLRASRRPKCGSRIDFAPDFFCRLLSDDAGADKACLELHYPPQSDLAATLARHGQVPLPPYISRPAGSTAQDSRRYQTVYAETPGAVAAPTAGLHFTPELLANLAEKGTQLARVTLHVGYGTFAPVREEDITRHRIHQEFLTISEETVNRVEETRLRGGKVWAVGTTSVRALEYGARHGSLQACRGWCDLYIYPGFQFRVVDNLITNFHLPGSSLLFLVAALCGRETLLSSYQTAIGAGYRFFSYGDAMAVVNCRR